MGTWVEFQTVFPKHQIRTYAPCIHHHHLITFDCHVPATPCRSSIIEHRMSMCFINRQITTHGYDHIRSGPTRERCAHICPHGPLPGPGLLETLTYTTRFLTHTPFTRMSVAFAAVTQGPPGIQPFVARFILDFRRLGGPVLE